MNNRWALIVVVVSMLLLPCCGGAASDDKEVRTFLERYFPTWSAQDMDGYGGCFHSQARITYVGKNGQIESMGLTDFLHSQRMAHETSPVKMTEVPLEMKIHAGKLITQAAVTWKLSKGAETNTGTDNFTLVKDNGSWRIIALAFDQD